MAAQPSPTSTPGLRNNMYKLLVDDGSDLAGVFAYCIYKTNKRDFMRRIWAQHQRVPNDDEFSSFYMQCNLESSMAIFYENGTNAANRFLQEYMIQVGNEEMERLRKQELFQQVSAIRKEVEKSTSPGGWLMEGGRHVVASMIGVALIGILFVGADRVSKIHHALERLESVSEHEGTDKAPISTDSSSSMPPTAKGGSQAP